MEREAVLEMVKKVVLAALEKYDVKIYLFGSWARQSEKRSSDIDIAVGHEGDLPATVLPELRTMLEESNIPYRIDVLDLTLAEDFLRRKVIKEGIAWRA